MNNSRNFYDIKLKVDNNMSRNRINRKTNDLEILKQECMKNTEAKKFLDDELRAIHYETVNEGNATTYRKKENVL